MTNSSSVDRLFHALCALCAFLPLGCGVWFFLATLLRTLSTLPSFFLLSDLASLELFLHAELVGLAAAMAIPVGIGAAVVLEHLAERSVFTSIARRAIGLLAAVPSVLYGLCGATLLMVCLDVRSTFITTAVCLALFLIPVVVERTRNALKTVSPQMLEASIALGADPHRSLTQVILPLALPALASEMLVVLARALGTVAPLLVVDVFAAKPLPRKVDIVILPLSQRIFHSGTRPDPLDQQWAAGSVLVLLSIVVVIHVLANWLSKRRMTDTIRPRHEGSSERGVA